MPPIPALLHSTCAAPKRSIVNSASAATSASDAVSQIVAATSPPSSANRAVTSVSRGSSTSESTTCMPSATNAPAQRQSDPTRRAGDDGDLAPEVIHDRDGRRRSGCGRGRVGRQRLPNRTSTGPAPVAWASRSIIRAVLASARWRSWLWAAADSDASPAHLLERPVGRRRVDEEAADAVQEPSVAVHDMTLRRVEGRPRRGARAAAGPRALRPHSWWPGSPGRAGRRSRPRCRHRCRRPGRRPRTAG